MSDSELTLRQDTGRNGLHHLLAHCRERYFRRAQYARRRRRRPELELHQGLRRERRQVRQALRHSFEEMGLERSRALLDHWDHTGARARDEGDGWLPYCSKNVRAAANWLGQRPNGDDGGIESRLLSLEEHWLRKALQREVYPLLLALLSRGNAVLGLVHHLRETAEALGSGERLREAVMTAVCSTKVRRLHFLGTAEIWDALELSERHCQFVEPLQKRSVLHCGLHPESTRWFLEHGAVSLVNEFDDNYMTPVMCHILSSQEGDGSVPSSVPVLLEFGADPSKVRCVGFSTPLFDCTLNHVYNGDFEALICAGADSTQRFNCSNGSIFSRNCIAPASLELILAQGFDLQSTAKNGDTPLMEMVHTWPDSHEREAREEVMRILVERGCDVNATNHEGATALLGTLAYFEVLLELGARPDVVSADGASPLFRCVAISVGAIPEALLEPSIIDTFCTKTALYLARYGLRPITAACCRSNLQHLQQLLDAGACPSQIPGEATSPLREACKVRWVEGVELLLQRGAQVDQRATAVVPGSGEDSFLQETASKFVGRRTKRA